MGFISGLLLIVLGILGASSLIIAKKPDAKDLIGKLAPYQGWIGAVSVVWGAWNILSSLSHINYVAYAPIYWITWFASAATSLLLGILLGIGVFKMFITGPEANAKMDKLIVKLSPYQGKLGIVAIILGIWMIIAFFRYRVG